MNEITRLSYSSLSTYAECGEKWRLERGYGLNRSTWFATVAGSAIHTITELMDMGKTVPSFKEVFDYGLAKEAENAVEVKASGRKLKEIGKTGGPNKKDYDWWLIYGPQYVQNYETWRDQSDWEIANLDGELAIEVVIDEQIGGVDHKGFIDRVFITPDGELVIVDIKTGAEPSSKLQLGVYSVGLWRKYGLLSQWGSYWLAADGDLTSLVDLTHYTEEWIDEQFRMAWAGIEAGVFLPNVGNMCSGCGVRDWCRAVGGRRAGHELLEGNDLLFT